MAPSSQHSVRKLSHSRSLLLADSEKTTLASENFDGSRCGLTEEHQRRMLKKARLLTRPTQARRDAPFPKQGRNERPTMVLQACSNVLTYDDSTESHTARVERGPSKSLYLSLGQWPSLPFTARIERAQFHRARSASKKGTWPLPPLLADFFSILLRRTCAKNQRQKLKQRGAW